MVRKVAKRGTKGKCVLTA